jgi:O-antigen ligase
MTTARAGAALLWAGLCAHALFLAVSIAGMQIALGAAAAGLVLLLLAGHRLQRSPLDLPLLAFVLVAALSDLVSRHGPPTLVEATLWRSAAGFLVVYQGLRALPDSPRRAVQLLWFAGAGLCLAALVGLFQYQLGIDPLHALHLRQEPRVVPAPGVPGRYAALGFFVSRLTFANGAAVLSALVAGALVGGALQSPRARAAAVGTLALSLGGIVVAFDRAAWLGVLASVAVLVGVAGRRSRRVRAGVLAAALAASAVAALHPGVRGRFTSGFDVEGNRDRLFLWARALEIIRDHPLTGVGFANYRRVQGPYYDRVDPTFFMRTWAHNTELSLLAETGPLGLLAGLWVAVAAAVALARRAPGGRDAPPSVEARALALGALAAGAAIAVIGQVHDVLYDTKVMYPVWFAMALGLAPGPGSGTSSPPPAASAPGAQET